MRTTTDRCGAILDLIDRCLAEYEGEQLGQPLHDVTASPGGVRVATRLDARLAGA